MSALPAACKVRAPMRMPAVGEMAASMDAQRNIDQADLERPLAPPPVAQLPGQQEQSAANVTL